MSYFAKDHKDRPLKKTIIQNVIVLKLRPYSDLIRILTSTTHTLK